MVTGVKDVSPSFVRFKCAWTIQYVYIGKLAGKRMIGSAWFKIVWWCYLGCYCFQARLSHVNGDTYIFAHTCFYHFFSRPSNGGKFCIGERRRYRICNTEASFYSVQMNSSLDIVMLTSVFCVVIGMNLLFYYWTLTSWPLLSIMAKHVGTSYMSNTIYLGMLQAIIGHS